MKKEQLMKLLKKKIDSGTASKQDIRKYFLLKKSLSGVENKNVSIEHRMDKHLSNLSGMKGAEKSTKDKIGRNLNAGEHTYKTIDKVYDRINKRGNNDS
jgi:hypothetical protein